MIRNWYNQIPYPVYACLATFWNPIWVDMSSYFCGAYFQYVYIGILHGIDDWHFKFVKRSFKNLTKLDMTSTKVSSSKFEPHHDKTNKSVRPAKTQISLGIRPVRSVFAVRLMGSWGPTVSSCGQRRLWSDWADAQADLSVRCSHLPLCWFCHVAAQIYLQRAIQMVR